MSSGNYSELKNILDSLVSKGFVTKRADDCVILTQDGENYLWGF